MKSFFGSSPGRVANVTHSNQIGKRFIKAQAPYFSTTLPADAFFHCNSSQQTLRFMSFTVTHSTITCHAATSALFGLKMSYSKTETMAFNVDEEIKSQESLITIGDNKIKNVRTFKYLGYTITNEEKKTSRFLYARIGAAYQKWNKVKHVLTDRRIKLSTRVRFLTTCVRSRLLYSIQACSLTEKELDIIEVIWNSFFEENGEGWVPTHKYTHKQGKANNN